MGATTRRGLFGVLLLLFCGSSALSGRTPQPLQRVSIRVYDHAGVPEPVLARAETELHRLFARMDLGVDVVLCFRKNQLTETTCNLAPRANEFHVAIVGSIPEEISGRKIAPETCGFALLTEDVLENRRANIFYPCVQRTADDTQVPLGVVLGHLVAHEMAHLLLGTKQHSSEGLFRARIRPEDWRLASQGRLEFSRWEVGRLRAAVAVRVRPPNLYEVAGRAQSAPASSH